MADPFTMAAVGLTVAGGAVKAYGEYSAGQSNAAMYRYRARVAEINSQINRKNSDFTLDATDTNVRRSGLTTGFTIGKQKTAQAAGGFDVNTGTNLAVRDSTREIGREDQATIFKEGGRKALAYRNKAVMDDEESRMDMFAASQSERAGLISSLGTLLGTAGSVSSKWMQASQAYGSPSY